MDTLSVTAQNFINKEMGGSDLELSMERKAHSESNDEHTNGKDEPSLLGGK